MVSGLTTITYSADDVERAALWYTELLGTEPYFRKDFGGALAYVSFESGTTPTSSASSTVATPVPAPRSRGERSPTGRSTM